MHAKICLAAMEKYLNSQNKSIADSFALPSIDNYDKDVLLATIIRNYSTLPTLYDDPDWYYDDCEYWFKSHEYEFVKMWEVMIKEYDPIENYNRKETRTGNSTTVGSNQVNRNGTVAVDGETLGSGTIQIVDDTDTTNNSENKVSAFNEIDYQPSSKVSGTGTSDSTNTTTRDVKDKLKSNTTSNDILQSNDSSTTNDSYSLTNTGNIGVTTTQQMIEAELKLRMKSLYVIMANKFADEMCLGIW